MNSTDRNWQEYGRWLEQLRLRRGIPGMALRVFSADEILFESFPGYRNVEAGLPVDADTIFGIASVTKSFTALSVLHAATAGRLDLDDPVTRWLPELTLWRDRQAPTVRQLLTQTSGLPALPILVHAMAESGRGDPTEAFDPPLPAEELRPAGTLEEVIAFLNEDARVEEPGGLFCYQNDAWGLLGGIVSRASGSGFEDYVAEHITGPLGLTRTTFDLSRVLADRNATTLYATDPAGNVIESPKWHDSSALAGAGFLRSTARDLTSYVRFLMKGDGERIGIDDALLQEMQSPLVWCGPGGSYGYGLTINEDHHGVTLISHGGRLKGISSTIGYSPELGVGAVVLINLEEQPADLMWLGAINTVLGVPVDSPRYAPQPQPVNDEAVAALLGEYRSQEPWGRLVLQRSADGGLEVLDGEAERRLSAFWVSADEFGIRGEEQDQYVAVLRDPADPFGQPWGLHYGRRILYRR